MASKLYHRPLIDAIMRGTMAIKRIRRLTQQSNNCFNQHWNQKIIVLPLRSRERLFSSSSSSSSSSTNVETVKITYIDPSGKEHTVNAEIGKNLMDTAHDNNIELEGACGGELACSTCHLVFEKDVYDTLPPKADEEEDMLDLAFELTETSRLGCQIKVCKEFVGIKIRIPDDGY